MRLWVLKYKIGDLEIYLTPENAHSVNRQDALKFETQEKCEEYRNSFNSFLEFSPALEYFDFL